MKMKALVVALLCVMGLAAIFIGNAEAAPAYYTCTISAVGSNYNASYVILTETGSSLFTNRTFIIDNSTGHAKEMLAVFLTAWTNSNNVSVYLDTYTQYSTLWGVNTIQ